MARRILHVRSSGGMLGAERVILNLAASSIDHGYESIVAATHDAGDPYPALLLEAARLGHQTLTLPARWPWDPRSALTVRRAARELGVSLVHSHGYREDLLSLAAAHGLPRLATNHLWKTTTRRLRVYAALDALALRRFPHVVAVSAEILEGMLARGIDPDRLTHIPNGIDVKALRTDVPDTASAIRAELDIGTDAVVAAMISSLTPEKGHAYAIRALRRARDRGVDVTLLIVGDGPLRGQLGREAVDCGVASHVVFAGLRSDVPDMLAASDMFLMASTAEGLPMALLEAMAAAKPVVATGVGDIPEVVGDRAGIVVPSGDVAALGHGLARLGSDPELRQKMGLAARVRVEATYSAQRMTAAYCRIYDALLEGRT